jgi:hypothetical protein
LRGRCPPTALLPPPAPPDFPPFFFSFLAAGAVAALRGAAPGAVAVPPRRARGLAAALPAALGWLLGSKSSISLALNWKGAALRATVLPA